MALAQHSIWPAVFVQYLKYNIHSSFSIPASPALRVARGCWSQSRHVIGRKVGSYPRQVAGLSQSHVEPNACLWTKQTKQGFGSGIVPYIAEELMSPARTTVIERVSHQNMEAEQRRYVTGKCRCPSWLQECFGSTGGTPRKKGMRRRSFWPRAVICLGRAPATALSSYLRVLCNCSGALDPKPGRNICMFTFIILFQLYGGLPGSVCRRRIQGGKK